MIKENPLVSVIVTTYNRKQYLGECLHSILNQTFTDFELIVVDNYSNYDFYSFIESFNDKRIRAYQNKNYGIIAVNRNYGIRKSRGKYIAFCDDDDLWKEEKLEKQIKIIENRDVIAIGSNVIYFGDINLFTNKNINTINYIETYNFFDILKKSKSAPLSSLLVKNQMTFFDEDRKLINVEDWDYQLKLTINGSKIGIISEPLVLYRIKIIPESFVEKSNNILNVINKYKIYYSSKEYLEKISIYYLSIGVRYYKIYKPKLARNYLFKAIKIKPSFIIILGYIISFLPEIFIQKILLIYYKYKKTRYSPWTII